MEKRRSNRFNVYFNAIIISGKAEYNGFVGNISKNGLYARISSVDSNITLSGFNDFIVRLRLQDNEALHLTCRLIWSSEILFKKSNCQSAVNTGFNILGPVPEYRAFYDKMLVECFNERFKQFLP